MHFQPSDFFLILKRFLNTTRESEYDAKRRLAWKRFLEEEHL